MSGRRRRILAGTLALCLCLLGTAAGLTIAGSTETRAAKDDKVDGMIFWGTSGLAQMQTLIQKEKYAEDANRDVKTEYEQHKWVSADGGTYGRIGYGQFGSQYNAATGSGYAILQDWYPGWSPDTDVKNLAGGRVGQELKFDEHDDPSNPQREPTAGGSSGDNGLDAIMDALDEVTTAGPDGEPWGEDDEDKGGNGNDQPGDGIAIVIWAGEDWVVRNWDSSDLGFVGQEDGQLSTTMDTYSTQNVLLKYWMHLDGELLDGSMGQHKYDPAPWASAMDDGSVMHKKIKDDGISGDDTGTWSNGQFNSGSVAGKGLQPLNGHVGDQEVAVTTCNDKLYPNINQSIRLDDSKTSVEIDRGTDLKGTPGSDLTHTPYDRAEYGGEAGSHSYRKEGDDGTETPSGSSSKQEYTIQPAGNSKQVSQRYTEQWVEEDNGYHDYKNSGFSYNAIDDGITIDLSTHQLAATSDPIGDGYADGKKDSLATQVGTLFARVLSGYDYQVEYLTQDSDASAIPHNTDDTQLDDWYEVTYLSLKEVPCGHGPGCCADNCENYIYCDHNEHWEVSVQMIRVRSRCDTEAGVGTDKLANQNTGKADAGYADSYHIHVLGGVGMYDRFPVDGDLYDIPNDELTTSHQTNVNCGTAAEGFTGDYVGREDNGSVDGSAYEPHSTAEPTGTIHNCWEHLPTGGYANDNGDLTGLGNAYADQPSVPGVPYMPQKLKLESEQNGVFDGGFDWPCSHSPITGDHDGICIRDNGGCCCCCDHSADPPFHCMSSCRGYDKTRLCAYLRVMPVIEVPGFDGRTHNVIPTSVEAWDGSGYVNLNDQKLQFYQAAYAAAAQRYLRTWGEDNGNRKWEGYIHPNVVNQEKSIYKSGQYPWGMIKYETSSNPPSQTPATDPVSGTQYQTGSNYVNLKQDSHVYIRTWYTNPNKPIMKYVTETRHVTGYIETWLDKYPDAKVYVFGLGPYSKSTTEDTMDDNWATPAGVSVNDANYWTNMFGRDTNYDGRINGLDRVRTNNEGALDISTGNSGGGPGLTQLAEEPTKGKYTDTEGMWGTPDSLSDRNQQLMIEYTVGLPYYNGADGVRDVVGVAYPSQAALEEHLHEVFPTLTAAEITTKVNAMKTAKEIFEINGKYYQDADWLDLADYGGKVSAADKYLDEIARTKRIDNARKEYNEAVKANLKNAQFVDIWDLMLEHEPYFQYGSITDSANLNGGGTGGRNAVDAYHGKYYDQTTYSWIFHMMWATVLNDNKEQEETVEAISTGLYDLSSALTAYANTVLSVKGRTNLNESSTTTDGTAGDYSHKLPDIMATGFFGAGAALGYGDTAYGFTPGVVMPVSAGTSSVEYRSLVNAEMGDSYTQGDNSAMYIYARYGHLLQDLGLDETGLEASMSPRLAPGLLTSVGYVGNAALGVVWNVTFDVLDVMNPFRFLIGTPGGSYDGVITDVSSTQVAGGTPDSATNAFDTTKGELYEATTGSVAADSIPNLNNNNLAVKAMGPLIDYVTGLYMILKNIGLYIILPLFLVLFFASVLLLRKDWKKSALNFLVPFVFICVGIPFLGAAYTVVVEKCGELVNMAASPSSQLVASTFVDFQGWVERSRLAPPEDAGATAGPAATGTPSVKLISDGTDSQFSGKASGETMGQLRQIAWSINKSCNTIPAMNNTASVFNKVDVGQLDDSEYWGKVVTGTYDGEAYASKGMIANWKQRWSDAMSASQDIMDILGRYTNGDMYFASAFSSDTMAHFAKYYPDQIGTRKGAAAVTESNSATDAEEYTPDGVELADKPAKTYDENDNKYKLYGLFASASHGDDWLNRDWKENQDLLTGANVASNAVSGTTGAGTGENFTGFNPFANGRIAASVLSGSVPAGANSKIQYTQDSVQNFAKPTAGSTEWNRKSGLDWASNGGLSTVAMYNYLSSDFGDNAVTVYSSRNVINMHQEKAHYSVTTVGSGGTGIVYWLSCVAFLLCCCVLGFVYALGLVIQNIKSGMQMIMALPAATLGVKKSIVSVCSIVFSMIFQVISSVVLYHLASEILMVLVTLGDTVVRTSFEQGWGWGSTASAQMGGILAFVQAVAPSTVQASFVSQLIYMCGTTALTFLLGVGVVRSAPVAARISDKLFDWIMVRFMVPELAAGYLPMKAAARAAKAAKAEEKAAVKQASRVRARVRGIAAPAENTACEIDGNAV